MWPGLDTCVLHEPSPKGPYVALHVARWLFRYRIIDKSGKDIHRFLLTMTPKPLAKEAH